MARKFKMNVKIGKSKGGGGIAKLGAKLGGLGKGLGKFGKPTVAVSSAKFGGAGNYAKSPGAASPKVFKPKKVTLKKFK